jgi:dimethylamine/trimethylamine dehydrogenase
MPNVEIFRESHLTAEDVHAVGADHVVLATGARWRIERYDGNAYVAIVPKDINQTILTPDDIMDGKMPKGPTLIYDEDSYYLGGVIAEKISTAGIEVIYATPNDVVSKWTENTSERWRIQSHLMKLGIKLVLSKSLYSFDGNGAEMRCEYSGLSENLKVESLVMVTQRQVNRDLFDTLMDGVKGDHENLPFSLTRIGDCDAPAIIAAAVYAGHRYARQLDTRIDVDEPLIHDRLDVGQTPEGAYLINEE